MKVLIRNIAFTMKHSLGPFLINLILHGLYGVLPILASYVWKLLINRMQDFIDAKSVQMNTVIVYGFFYSAVYGLSVALPVAFEVIDTLLRNSVKKVAQIQIHNKMARIPYNQFDDAKINDYIINTSQVMTTGIFMYFSLNVTYFFGNIISLVSSMVLLHSYSDLLLIVFPILIIPVIGYAKVDKLNTQNKLDQTTVKRKMKGYEAYLLDPKYVKDTRLLDCADDFLDKRSKLLSSIKEKELYFEKQVCSYQILSSTINAIAYGTILGLGIYLTSQGKISIAEFASMISVVGVVYQTYNQMLDDMKEIPSEKLEIESGFKLLDYTEGEYNEHEVSLSKDLQVLNVAFHYPLSERNVLSNVNLQINQGQVVAFVGQNGVGKSTLVKLIAGLYEPTEGSISYDGKEISKVDRSELFSLVSAVFEDYNHYGLTIEENITLSDEVKEERLKEAIKTTGCDRIVEKQADKEKTFLGKKYGGTDLSGGEWQKLALARGYYKDSKIIILDEPTAALDPMAEYDIYNQFRTMCKGKIGIIVTHRLPAASLADYIYYIGNGQILEEGTHAALMKQNGEYATIYNSQKELYL